MRSPSCSGLLAVGSSLERREEASWRKGVAVVISGHSNQGCGKWYLSSNFFGVEVCMCPIGQHTAINGWIALAHKLPYKAI